MDELAYQQWLKIKIASLAALKFEEIGVDEPFASYGLDSLSAISLSSDLEDLTKLKLPATLAWDYPTIAQLSKFLAQSCQSKKTSPGDVV